jgi:hypothetical protein
MPLVPLPSISLSQVLTLGASATSAPLQPYPRPLCLQPLLHPSPPLRFYLRRRLRLCFPRSMAPYYDSPTSLSAPTLPRLHLRLHRPRRFSSLLPQLLPLSIPSVHRPLLLVPSLPFSPPPHQLSPWSLTFGPSPPCSSSTLLFFPRPRDFSFPAVSYTSGPPTTSALNH